MDSDDPDLQAFESNLRRILRERELGKAAALVPNLWPNVSDPQSIGVSSKDNFRRESPCGTSSQSDSEVFTGWSRNILRMQVPRAYLFFYWPLVLREDLWRHSSGGGVGAIFTNFLKNLSSCVLHSRTQKYWVRMLCPDRVRPRPKP